MIVNTVLQGMFNFNYLLFINFEDYFKEIKIIEDNSDNRVCFFFWI